jgi:hypothetical protein
MNAPPPGCKACGFQARLKPEAVQRIIDDYFGDETPALADAETWRRRLDVCGTCPDLLLGNTCRHCGCLVEIRARIAEKACPAPRPRW